jgi:hypothetical protein
MKLRAARTAALLLATVLAMLVVGGSSALASGPNAIITNPGCQTTTLPANDDGSSPNVTLPFPINFFGNTFNSLWVNNNGNVTFTGPLSTFTPEPILSTATPIIAPFWADVDTRGAGSGQAQYGPISAGATEVGGHQAFCVNWVNVGYFASHTDKLNSFQLVLIDRSDTGSGNFDIEFNYNQVQWETGDASSGSGGLGGNSARAGYSNGSSASFELPGSAVNGAFLDTNATTGLIYNNINSPLHAGRYVFPVRNGAATGHSISGHVWANTVGTPAANALIQACPIPFDTPCRLAQSLGDGSYALNNLPDSTSGGGAVDHDWNLVVNPPGGSGLSQGNAGPIHVAGANVSNVDVTLHGPAPLPAGASITQTSRGTQTTGVPTIYWGDPFTLVVHGCNGGTSATATLTTADGLNETLPLVENPPGTYTVTFPSPYPHHGNAHISWTITCAGTPVPGSFDMYIDPSGTVVNQSNAPVSGATVTLLRSDDPAGPFVQVPNGSAIMSPSNQNNPDTTNAAGQFGWDVVAGFYKVQATAPNCNTVSTPVLTIPPPALNIVIQLTCTSTGDTTPPVIHVPADITAEATGASGAAVTYVVTATDPDDASSVLTLACLPASGSTFALGQTTVNCNAHDPAGNPATASFHVNVVDTTPPTVTVPGPITVDATSPAGAVVTYTATATDLVDGSVTPTCLPASGSTFPAGDTTVSCTAHDSHGNTSAPKTFTVHVRGAAELLGKLATDSTGVGPGTSFADKARSAQSSLAAGDKAGACGTLGAYLNELSAQTGKKVTAAQAASLTAEVNRIRAVIGC